MENIIQYIKFKTSYYKLKLYMKLFCIFSNMKIRHFIIRRIERLLRGLEKTKYKSFINGK